MKEARVLLADSHMLMLEGLNYLLRPTFEVVGLVSDTKSLIEAADKLKPDIAVADLSMPAFNEVNAVRKLKDRHPELKVIVLSVHDEPTVVQETLATGVSGYVLLRSAAWDLMPAIQKVLQGKTYVSPTVRLI
ncbi:MAG: response regulator transcription factor [Candidatus Binatia bacterium]